VFNLLNYLILNIIPHPKHLGWGINKVFSAFGGSAWLELAFFFIEVSLSKRKNQLLLIVL